MKILAVDDEKIALEGLENSIKKAVPQAEIYSFRKPEEALKFCTERPCDIAFLDIEMRGINGIDLARDIQQLYPKTNIIFITGYMNYTIDAFEIHASGYVNKPVTAEKIRTEMQNLRYKISEKKLEVQCFGNFDVFHNGQPLKFSRSKTKELFAYLVDRRGASANTNQLCAVLWDEKEDSPSVKSMFRMLVQDLKRTLSKINAEDVLIARHNSFSVNTELIDCDYYQYLSSDTNIDKRYNGEYMLQYSWAEIRNYNLNNF